MGREQTDRTIDIWGMRRGADGRIWFPLGEAHVNGHGDDSWFSLAETDEGDVAIYMPDWTFNGEGEVSILSRLVMEAKDVVWSCPEYNHLRFTMPDNRELHWWMRDVECHRVEKPQNPDGFGEFVLILPKMEPIELLKSKPNRLKEIDGEDW